MEPRLKGFNSLVLDRKISLIEDFAEFVYRVQGIHYTIDLYSLGPEYVALTFHVGSQRITAVDMLSYGDLDNYIASIEIPWKAKKK